MQSTVKIQVEMDVPVKNKEEIINGFVQQALDLGVVEEGQSDEVIRAFLNREDQGTTGLVDGYAIAQSESGYINNAALIIYKLENSVDWDSMDGQSVDFIFGILVPSNENITDSSKVLDELSEMLLKKEAKNKLSTANSEEEVLAVLKEYTSIA